MIELQQIHKTYPRPEAEPLAVLKSIDFSVEPGEMVAIVGPSGSGKTTLMNVLGLLDRPDSGDYRLDGQAVDGLDKKELARIRNRTIGFVFQQFHLLPRTTALENVELPLVYAEGVSDAAGKAAAALCRVGLEDRLSHYPNELSGGQQQRVAIARALVNDPQVILADEPTGNLDREAGRGILELFEELHRDGRTILFITHDPDLARRAPRTVRLEDGGLYQ